MRDVQKLRAIFSSYSKPELHRIVALLQEYLTSQIRMAEILHHDPAVCDELLIDIERWLYLVFFTLSVSTILHSHSYGFLSMLSRVEYINGLSDMLNWN